MRKDVMWQDKDLVASYLSGVRGAIPLATEQIDMMLRLIAGLGDGTVERFLDLGCGDGVLAQAVLTRYPDAHAVLYDFSQPMLDAAQEKLGKEHVTLIQGDYAPADWTAALGDKAPFDAIVSGFSIHHQPDDVKQRIYRDLYELLRPGGVFLNLEHVSSPSPQVEHMYDELFIDALVAYRHSVGSDETRDEIAKTYYYRPDKSANILAPVELQCDWLREIGYAHVDCYFKVFELALFGGVKPA